LINFHGFDILVWLILINLKKTLGQAQCDIANTNCLFQFGLSHQSLYYLKFWLKPIDCFSLKTG